MERGSRIRRGVMGVLKVLAFLVASYALLELVVFTGLAAVSARYWAAYDGRGLNEPWFLTSAIAGLAVVWSVCVVFLRCGGRTISSHLRLGRRRSASFLAVGMLLSAIAVGGIVAVAVASGEMRVAASAAPWSRGLSYLVLMLAGGFALVLQEEMVYRGYVLRVLETHVGAVPAIAGTSVLFALAHLARTNVSLLGVANITVMGALLAVVCVKSGSLWFPVGLHFGWNSILYVFDLPISGNRYPNFLLDAHTIESSAFTGSAFGPEDSTLVTGIMLACLVVALRWRGVVRLEDEG